MPTPVSSYLGLFSAAVGAAIGIAFGAIISVAVPCLLVERLRNFAARDASATPTQPDRGVERTAARKHGHFWNAILGITTSFAATGFFGASYYFYAAEGDMAATAIAKGTLVVVGSAVGAALSGGAVLLLGGGSLG